jgi:hypothetical protein
MIKQSVEKVEPDKDRSDSLAGFLRFPPPPVWICPNPPAPPFEFFDIQRPHFYVIHGVPMAFAGDQAQ